MLNLKIIYGDGWIEIVGDTAKNVKLPSGRRLFVRRFWRMRRGCPLGDSGHRVKARATAKSLMEGCAEMAETGVTDLQRDFRYIVLATAQELCGFVHAQLPEILRDGLACLRGKDAAEIKMAATDLLPEFLQ